MALGALDIIIAADTAQLRKGMDEAVGIVKSSTKTMESAAKTAAGAIAGYFAFDSIKGSIQHTLDFADSLSKMSQKVGVSVDALYAMQAAGKLADVDINTLEKSLLKFNKGLGSASMGSGDTANALENLGISLKDSSGHLKTSDQYLFEVADKFQKMPNGIAKSTLAMELFGKSGADMIPLLNGGSEALKEYSGIINTDTAQAAERFNDSMTKIGLSAETSATKILTGMLPTIESLSGTFEDMADWVLKNQSTIDEFTAQAGNDLTALGMVGADAFGLISDTSGDMLKTVASVFNEIPGLMGRSSDDAIENFGFFEYFILGMSTATNGIGQFVANAKMAYATVAEYHAKYGSIGGLLTNGGYDAAKARMDYHAADLEAKKYTKNVSDTYNALIGFKKDFKSKNGGSENPHQSFDLEDFDKNTNTLKKQLDEDEKIRKGYLDGWADLEAKAAIEEYENKLKKLDAYADLEAKAAIEQYEIEKGYLEAYADLEAKAAIEQYENELELKKKAAEEAIKPWNDFFADFDRAMENQLFDAMTGKWQSFGNWLSDFWSSLMTSMSRAMSSQLSDAITSSLRSALSGGMSASSGGFSIDGITSMFSGSILDSFDSLASGVTSIMSKTGLFSQSTIANTGFGIGGFGNGLASPFTSGFAQGGTGMSGAGGTLGAAGIGAAGGYAVGSIGDSLFGTQTQAANYGAIGGGIGAAVGGPIGAAIGATIGSIAGGMIGEFNKAGYRFSEDTTGDLSSVKSKYTKKVWGNNDDKYKVLTDAERKSIDSLFDTYNYLLDSIGAVDDIVIKAGTVKNLEQTMSKAFLTALGVEDSKAVYKVWEDYAKGIDKTVTQAMSEAVGQMVTSKREFELWVLGSNNDTLGAAAKQAEWANKSFIDLAKSMDVVGVTVENYLTKYDEAVKSSFDPSTITQWDALGDALRGATDAADAYNRAIADQVNAMREQYSEVGSGLVRSRLDVGTAINGVMGVIPSGYDSYIAGQYSSGSYDDMTRIISEAYNYEKNLIDEKYKAEFDAVNSIKDAASDIKKYSSNLFYQNSVTAVPNEYALSYLNKAITAFQSGDVSASGDIKKYSDDYVKYLLATSVSGADYNFKLAAMSAKLGSVGGITESAADIAIARLNQDMSSSLLSLQNKAVSGLIAIRETIDKQIVATRLIVDSSDYDTQQIIQALAGLGLTIDSSWTPDGTLDQYTQIISMYLDKGILATQINTDGIDYWVREMSSNSTDAISEMMDVAIAQQSSIGAATDAVDSLTTVTGLTIDSLASATETTIESLSDVTGKGLEYLKGSIDDMTGGISKYTGDVSSSIDTLTKSVKTDLAQSIIHAITASNTASYQSVSMQPILPKAVTSLFSGIPFLDKALSTPIPIVQSEAINTTQAVIKLIEVVKTLLERTETIQTENIAMRKLLERQGFAEGWA